ncbi:hypothetical protein AAF712_011030 [Marasmius tenuissimus]|uniref:NAD(P)-binding domain-containing protein n=1 Tax=Marasmius tenuissimus TaxID=585030 RepID=A0ABR2ZN05_9AGAR
MSTKESSQVVVIAGASDLAKYFVEELVAHGKRQIVLLSRAKRDWFSDRPEVTTHITDYSLESIQSILNTTKATVLFSFLHSNDTAMYNTAHSAMLEACKSSSTCKRFVPSEYGGNLETYPLLPRFYAPTHAEFRKELERNAGDVEWTLVNIGWFMDYFAPVGKSYMKPLHPVWPLNLEKWEVVILGTGDEPIAWTSARDVAKALVRLIDCNDWEKHTYLCGELGSWNKAIRQVEDYYGPRWGDGPMKKTRRSAAEVETALTEHASDEDPSSLWKAYMDEWNVTGASAVPWDIVMRQRERYFDGIGFRSIQQLMKDAEKCEKV